MKTPIIFFIFFLFFLNVNANNACEYQDKIKQCVDANANQTSRSITEFICPQSWDSEEIAYQIILDLKFKEIDKEVTEFMNSLQEWKNYYFWPDRKKSYLDWVNHINEVFWEYGVLWKRYREICDPSKDTSIVKAFLNCSTKTSTNTAWTYFPETECMRLVNYKLNVNRNVSYNVMQTNKLQILKDFRKKQFQITRTKYDKLIDNMFINLDDITRINWQWNYKTQQCY